MTSVRWKVYSEAHQIRLESEIKDALTLSATGSFLANNLHFI